MRRELEAKPKPRPPEPPPVRAPPESTVAAWPREPRPASIVAVMTMMASGEERPGPPLPPSDQMRVFLAARRVRVVDRGAQQAAFRALLDEEKARSYEGCFDEA